ncbi:hypothetical protein BGZ59_006413 [Podila verticillata]|nr:hypothetical protein BGZ59_006413 [Podila verticillata]
MNRPSSTTTPTPTRSPSSITTTAATSTTPSTPPPIATLHLPSGSAAHRLETSRLIDKAIDLCYIPFLGNVIRNALVNYLTLLPTLPEPQEAVVLNNPAFHQMRYVDAERERVRALRPVERRREASEYRPLEMRMNEVEMLLQVKTLGY